MDGDCLMAVPADLMLAGRRHGRCFVLTLEPLLMMADGSIVISAALVFGWWLPIASVLTIDPSSVMTNGSAMVLELSLVIGRRLATPCVSTLMAALGFSCAGVLSSQLSAMYGGGVLAAEIVYGRMAKADFSMCGGGLEAPEILQGRCQRRSSRR